MTDSQDVIKNSASRVVLREVREADWQFVQAMGCSGQPDFSSKLQSEADCQHYIRQFLAQQLQNPRQQYRFMIVVKQSDQPIGWCDLYLESGCSAEVGYRINVQYWGQGYATEAVGLAIEYAFLTLQVKFVWAEVQVENPASVRVLEKLGMQRQSRNNLEAIHYRLERQFWQYEK